MVGNAAEGAYCIAFPFVLGQTGQDFAQRYVAEHDSDPFVPAQAGYDLVMLSAEASGGKSVGGREFIQNVLDMVFFVTGGKTMTRPYSSSSNYILKMSNYKKSDGVEDNKNKKKEEQPWAEKWDQLYYSFVNRNKKKLWKFRYYFPSLKSKK